MDPETASGPAVLSEVDRAVRSLREAGFESGLLPRVLNGPLPQSESTVLSEPETAVLSGGGAGGSTFLSMDEEAAGTVLSGDGETERTGGPGQPARGAEQGRGFDPEETLILCGSGRVLNALRRKGFYTAGYSHAGNTGQSFPGASYIIQEPDMVDPDSYIKIFEREAGLPWTIIRTKRCLVREFEVRDLDSIYALYDSQARRFLEPPSDDRGREREILQAYIDRIYRLYGFGHWAVLAREPEEGEEVCRLPVPPGTLIGRIGFSALTSAMEKELKAMGAADADADFGFLVAASCRGTGAAEEVCRAVLDYGFSQLGFLRIRADAHFMNRKSAGLMKKLGFKPLGRAGEKIIFFMDAP